MGLSAQTYRKPHPRPPAESYEPHIRLDVAERPSPARVDHEPELAGQGAQILVDCEPRLERGRDRRDIEERLRIDVAERTRDDVAHAFGRRIRVDEPLGRQPRLQFVQLRLDDSAQLQIASRGDFDRSVTAIASARRQRFGLIEAQPPRGYSHTDEQAVAGRHRPQCAGTPAFDGHAHAAPAIKCSRIAALELRRETQKPRRRASANFVAMPLAASGLAATRNSRTASSPSVASK